MNNKTIWNRYMKTPYGVGLIYLAIALTVFGPFMFKNFSSDDFEIIYGVATKGILIKPGFFRPISDISLLFNYHLFGFNPVGYFFFNLLIHTINAFLVYTFCRSFFAENETTYLSISFLSGLLFLIYPFHSEALFWVVGRASTIATLSFLIALNFIYVEARSLLKLFVIGVFYFLAISSYESALALPLLLMPFFWLRYPSLRALIVYTLVMTFVFVSNVYLRFHFAGTLTGSYANSVFHLKVSTYVLQYYKHFARLFILPLKHSWIFGLFSVIAVATLGLACYFYTRMRQRAMNLLLTIMIITLFVSILVPALFPVSTKTSESDRLLYLPSIFAVVLFTQIVLGLLKTYKNKLLLLSITYSFALVGSYIGALHWQNASEQTGLILSSAKEKIAKGDTCYFVNIPDEYEGAYIFRHGFIEALQMHQVDTAFVSFAYIHVVKDLSNDPVLHSDSLKKVYIVAKDLFFLKHTKEATIEIWQEGVCTKKFREGRSHVFEWRNGNFETVF